MKKKIMFLAMMLVMCFTFLPAVVHAGMPSVNIHEQTGLPIAVTGDEFEKGCYIVADSDNPVWCVYDRRNNILFLTKLDKTYELAEIRSELYGDKETRGFKKLTEQCSIETLLKEIVAVPSYEEPFTVPDKVTVAVHDYLNFSSKNDFNIAISDGSDKTTRKRETNIQYLVKDKGAVVGSSEVWTSLVSNTPVNVSNSKKIYFRMNPENKSRYSGSFYTTSNEISAGGSVTSVSTSPLYFSMNGLFRGMEALIEAPQIPALHFGKGACNELFSGCKKLKKAPALPIRFLYGDDSDDGYVDGYDNIYKNMFKGCESLETLPVLKATVLAEGCYEDMFADCGRLKLTGLEDPWFIQTNGNYVLPATKLEKSCYKEMFYSTDIETIPTELLKNVTTLAPNCYDGMFKFCTGVKVIPDDLLSVSTLADSCYSNMFFATNINAIPADLLKNVTTLAPNCYSGMFQSCSRITEIPSGLLPLTNLENGCYSKMFSSCNSLTEIPSDLLPATTLKDKCYANMFDSCKKLNAIPTDLLKNVSTLAPNCYDHMFYGCSAINEIPQGLLPIGTLATSCYEAMFQGCSSVTDIPDNLFENATVLAEGCYKNMFNNSGIKNIPAGLLPVRTLANSCYYGMFQNCKSLANIPETLLPATTLAQNCYYNMFNGTGITSIPEGLLPATDLTGCDYCYYGMFQNCTSLANIPETLLPATALAKYCYYNMFNGTVITSIPEGLLPSTDLTGCDNCYYGMFQNCKSLANIPGTLLPATALAQNCYYCMFNGTGIESIPEGLLPATDLTGCNYCYDGMFSSCKSLKTIPETLLPATTLAEQCYYYMFQNCVSLKTVPEKLLPATTLAGKCYYGMFYGCSELEKAPELPAETLVLYCYSFMFRGCSKLDSLTVGFKEFNPSNATQNWLQLVTTAGLYRVPKDFATFTASANTFPASWKKFVAKELPQIFSFEDDPFSETNGWTRNPDTGFVVSSGTGRDNSNDVYSVALDDMLISPALDIPSGGAKVSWYTNSADGTSTYTVLIGTSSKPDTMTQFYPASGSETAPADWAQIEIDIPDDYNGKAVYIAIKHEDANRLDIDDFAVISKIPKFDPCNGEAVTISETAPSVTWGSYIFDGWYDAKIGGTLLTGTPVNGITYYAHWKNASGKYILAETLTVKEDGLYIGGVLADNTALEQYGINFTAAADPDPAIIELDGATIAPTLEKPTDSGDTTCFYAAIYNDNCPVKVSVISESSVLVNDFVPSTDKKNVVCGIYTTKDLMISDEKLNVLANGHNNADFAMAVYGENASISIEGKLRAEAQNSSESAVGLQSGGNINISQNAEVTAISSRTMEGSTKYSDGIAVTNEGDIIIEDNAVVNAYGGNGTDEYDGLWTKGNIQIKGNSQLNVYGGTKIGSNPVVKESLYLGKGDKAITISDNAKIVADSDVKNMGTYADNYTVNGAQTDITRGAGGLTLNRIGDANIEISAKKYTVTFNANGGTPVPEPYKTTADVYEPPVPEKSGFVFCGWFKDPAFTRVWNFEDEYARADVTLYAKWAVSSSVATISGTVMDESSTPLENANVFIMRGEAVYDMRQTAPDGSFSFDGVPAGEYQLVVNYNNGEEFFTTELVKVDENGVVTGGEEIIIYTNSKTSSLVEIKGSSTPDVMAGGLDKVALANKDDSNDVNVTLKVESKTSDNVNPSDKAKIESAIGNGKALEFIDMTLWRTVGEGDPTTISDTGVDNLLEIVIPFDMNGVNNVALYRQHGDDAAAAKIPEGEANAADGEYVIIDKVNNRIRAQLRYFSTYAIVDEGQTIDPDPTYTITGANAENGSLTISTKESLAGQTVTVTATPDEGYYLKSIVATDKNGKEIELNDLGAGKYSFIMPSADVVIEAIFEKLLDDTCPESKFKDVDLKAWYHDGVHFCVKNGIMKGVSDTKFDINGKNTRSMIVTMLWRLDGEKYVDYEITFHDVPGGQWYTEAIRWAASEKIVNGYDTKHFGPNDPITREQLSTILYNYAKYKGQGYDGDLTFPLDFVDRDEISSWADEAVHWCNMMGVVNGKQGKRFDPQGTATRVEAATMVQRFCKALEN